MVAESTGFPLGRAAAVVPGAVAGWLVAALLLLLAGAYGPAGWLLGCLPAATAGGLLGWRAAAADRTPWVPAALTVVVAVGFATVSWLTASPQVVVRRDAGSYAVTATWLAHHGSLPMPAHRDVFGSATGVTTGSPGFYARGESVVPQFVTGLPLLVAPAVRAGGGGSAPRTNAVLGAFAVLAVAATGRRLGGPWAAPLTALLLVSAHPVLHAARTTLSEPAAQLLVAGGLGILTDAMRGTRRWPLAAGTFLVALTSVVRIDALAEVLPLVPFVLLQRGRRAPLVGGLAAGAAAGVVDGLLFSRPYLAALRGELLAVVGAAAVLVVAALVVARVRPRLPTWTAAAAGGAVLAAAVAVAVRPLVQTVRDPGSGARHVIAGIQVREGVSVDGSRTYVENAGTWLAWWVGIPALVLAVAALAVLSARAVRGRVPEAVPFLLVSAGSAALVLWHPAITPDHPWADRRFVPVVLPAVAVFAAWSVTHGAAWLRARVGAAAATAAAVVASVLAVAPAAVASAPLATDRTEVGEPGLLAEVCAALPPRAAVLTVGARAVLELTPAVRVRCAVPTAAVTEPEPAALRAAARAAAAHGRTLVVLAEDPRSLAGLGAPTRVARLVTREDARLLERRPRATVPLVVEVWSSAPQQ